MRAARCNTQKRGLVSVLAIVLTLALVATGLSAAPAGAATVAENAHSGGWYATTSTSSPGGGVYADVPDATSAGQLICGSAWVRTQYPATGAAGTFALWLIGGSGSESGGVSYSNLGTLGDWTRLDTCVEATASHTAVRIQFYPTPGSPPVAMDDVDVHASLAVNGGFENGSGPWTIYPGTASNYSDYAAGSSNPARSGSHFAATNTSQDGGGIYEDVALNTTAGQLICGSAWLRNEGNATGATGTFALWLIGGGAPDSGSTPWNNLGNGADWRQFSTCVEATSSHTTLRIQFYPTPGSPTTEIDDVDVHASLAPNGGFEYGSAPWGIYPGTSSSYDVLRSGQVPVPAAPAAAAPPVTTVVPVSHHRRALRIRLALHWTWHKHRADTRLDWIRIGRMPRSTRLLVTCSGRRCPLPRRMTASGPRRIRRLLRRLVGRRWWAGDRLGVLLSARRYSAERAVLAFRAGRGPTIRP